MRSLSLHLAPNQGHIKNPKMGGPFCRYWVIPTKKTWFAVNKARVLTADFDQRMVVLLKFSGMQLVLKVYSKLTCCVVVCICRGRVAGGWADECERGDHKL